MLISLLEKSGRRPNMQICMQRQQRTIEQLHPRDGARGGTIFFGARAEGAASSCRV